METIKQQIKAIRTKDGALIHQTVYYPEYPNNSVLIIGPSAVVNQDFYKAFALFFRAQNFTVITFDYRGVGRSLNGPLQGYEATLSQWGVFDLDAVILNAKNQFPRHEIIYLGHQISGEIIGLAPASQFINRIILICSGLSSWRLWPLNKRLIILMIKFFRPLLSRIYGYFPGQKLRYLQNLPAGVVEEWASLCNNKQGLFEVFTERNHHQFCGQLLACSFREDWLAPPRAVNALLEKFPNATIQQRYLTSVGLDVKCISHLKFFNPKLADTIWSEVLFWLNNRAVS